MRFIVLLVALLSAQSVLADFKVIAHRGASGYLPELTLPSLAVAHAMDPDLIEIDVVLSKDGTLIVLHDLILDHVTNVADAFSKSRRRADGHYYARDFTAEEIARLESHERLRNSKQAYPQRFPASYKMFQIPTLQQALDLIRGMNISRQKAIGLLIEVKAPAWHTQHGQDIMTALADQLAANHLPATDLPVIVQSFDAAALKRFHDLSKKKFELYQLVGLNSWRESPTDYEQLLTPAGLGNVKTYATTLGPSIPQVAKVEDGKIVATEVINRAHATGLKVIPYTLRTDATPPPLTAKALLQELMRLGVDGIITDFPDAARTWAKEGTPGKIP